MKIRCENCGAKYSISEDLLKKKVTKFRCKKCQNIMVVRASEEEDEDDLHASSAGHEDFVEESTVATESPLAQARAVQELHEQYSYETSEPAVSIDPEYGGYTAAEQAAIAAAQGYQAPPSAEPDLFAGMDTRATPHSYTSPAPQISKADQDLDDEFEKGFQEQEEEATQVRRAPSSQPQNYDNIAANHQEQGIVSLKDARAAAREVEDVDTRVFGISELQKLRTEKKEAQKKKEDAIRQRVGGGVAARGAPGGDKWHSSPPPPVVREDPEWHVLADDQQLGPLTLSDVKTKLRSKEIDPDNLIWKEGFGDWKPIAEVPTFTAAVANIGMPSSASLSALPASNGGSSALVPTNGSAKSGPISFAPHVPAGPKNTGDLQALAGMELSNIPTGPSKPASHAAALLAEPDIGAPPAFGGNLGPATSFPSSSPVATGNFNAFSTSASPFKEEKEGSSTKFVIIGLVCVVLLLLGGGGIFVWSMVQEMKNKPAPIAQQGGPVVAPPRAVPVVAPPSLVAPRVVAVATPRPVPTQPVGATTPQPAPTQRTEPAAAPTPRRRSRRSRRSSRRSRRSRRRSSTRYTPPRRRASGGGDALPPPPPPPGGGGDLPPPPPPGGDTPPPPRSRTGLNENALKSLLGGRDAPPPPPRVSSRPPPRANLPSTLSRGQVAGVIRRKGYTLNTCQENFSTSTKRISVSWSIQRSGRPASISVNPSPNSRFVSCIKRAVSKWRFPRFSGDPIDISGVPFKFE